MKKRFALKSCFALAACFAFTPLLLSCTETKENHFEGVHAFKVTVVPYIGGFGTEANPLKYPTSFVNAAGECPAGETCFKMRLQARAVGIDGEFLPDYNDTVSINAVPGKLDIDHVTFQNGIAGEYIENEDGTVTFSEGIDIQLRYAYGPTRIWVEDVDQKPVLSMPGMVCPNDRYSADRRKCEPSLATGVSQEYTFEQQTIKMIQYNPDQLDGDSPLLREYGQIKAQKGHDLVVTNVVSTGFYLTDLGDDDYNSIFIFTYSQPGRVEIGDRVCEVSGGIAEFTGMTQLQFPSWGIQNKERSTAEDTDPAPEDGEQGVGTCIDKETGEVRDCTPEELEAMNAIVDCSDVYYDHVLTKEEKKTFAYVAPPAPRVLTADILKLNELSASTGKVGYDGSSVRTHPTQTNALEKLEGSVITIENIRLSTEFINCDDNGNGKIESNSEESDCRTACSNNSKRCTELSNLDSYDQWRAWTIEKNPDGSISDTTGAEVSVSSSSLISGFDITKGCVTWDDLTTGRRMMRCPQRHLLRLTGNLKQILPGCSGTALCFASKWRPAMVMTVIEPRIKTDLIMDEEFNAKAEIEFANCYADDRQYGCWETCKADGGVCTCEAFEKYRKTHNTDKNNKPLDPSLLRCRENYNN